jgi:hypothetical protein
MTTPVQAVEGNAQKASDEAERSARPGGSILQRKYGPLPGWAWAGLAGGGALVWFWWRRREQSQASTASATVASTGTGTGYAGSLAGLQGEIGALQGQASSRGTATTTIAGPGGGTVVTSTAVTTTGKTSAPVTGPGDYPAPGGLHVTPAKTSAKATWSAVAGAPEYHFQVLTLGTKIVTDQIVHGTSANVTGLTAGGTYRARVSVLDPSGRHGEWTGFTQFSTPKS